MHVECPHCAQPHDLEAIEPSFRRPDEFLELIEGDDVEHIDGRDACAARSAAGSWDRYFIRVLVPFTVDGLDSPLSWGAWVEITPEQWERVGELWDAPDQSAEPPFAARLANEIPLYEHTMEITGLVSLSDPAHVPTFHMTAPEGHPFVQEQRTGVSARRAAEWLVLVYHPEAAMQQKIDRLLAARRMPRESE